MDHLPMSQHHIKESVVLLLMRILFTLAFIELIYLVFFLLALTPNLDEFRVLLSTVVVIGYFFKGFLEIIFIFRLIIAWATTSYYLSETELIKHTGLLRVEEEVYDLLNLRGAHRHQSWLGKRLNYGTLHLDLAYFGYNKTISLRGIRSPKKYLHILEEHLLKNQAKKSSPENPDERSTV